MTMGSERQRESTPAPGPPKRLCHACEHPVHSEVKRHKTMGIYVPVWAEGPCRNPLCERYVRPPAGTEHRATDDTGP